VSLESCILGEPLAAGLAHVFFVLGMDLLVPIQVLGAGEALVAHIALFVANVQVPLDVIPQDGSLKETLAADVALGHRALLMPPFVPLEEGDGAEAAAADVTAVGSFTGMRTAMDYEIRAGGEPLAALLAAQVVVLRVPPQMNGEIAHLGEALSTCGTHKG